MTGAPVISVVVATRDRADRLPRFLACLEAQRFDAPFEVVFVDDASVDDTVAVLDRLASTSALDMRCLHREVSGGPGGARNTGWRAARAPLVAFTDDDCEPQPEWLATVYRALATADLVQGRTLPNPAQVAAHGPFGRTLSVTEEGLYPTCNMGYRRAVLEKMDGFDERYRTSCEDTDLAWRARESGAVARWAPEALVYHDVHASDYRAYLRDKLRWDGVALVLHDHPILRKHLHLGVFWKRSHLPALAAAAGTLVAASALASRRSWPTRFASLVAGAALCQPYVRFRTKTVPLKASPRRRVVLLPAALAADLFEIGVMAAASARHKALVL
jgi:glycosyltransferase involved in cell wall biosynthesis